MSAQGAPAPSWTEEILDGDPITVERLDQALLLVAYFMERDGPVYAPLYERLERELEVLKRTEATVERAHQRLLAATVKQLAEVGIDRKRIADPR
ncbi:hypothetical protein OZ411_01495 [Bradyrhizobium sp. Arg237L]|uniref:hypothetical protein n=1 Tax=Bradyrhizobium sp. Arg237L TaxID=3003352 RepID=UPI00249F87D1|nr:hypothetical protein [Bradyrhizobium sp. Arg237L]MDI4231487.1 hypothetical protein [Bradyrhizobium sp. Arg237L]